MEAASVFIKTPNGRTELRSREHRLSLRERATLIMIDGQRCLAELQGLSPVPGEVEQHLCRFLESGLIIPTTFAPRFGTNLASPSPAGISTAGDGDALSESVPRAASSDMDKVCLYILAVAQDTLGAGAEEFGRRLALSNNAQELLSLAHHLRENLNRFVNAKKANQCWETVREIAPKA